MTSLGSILWGILVLVVGGLVAWPIFRGPKRDDDRPWFGGRGIMRRQPPIETPKSMPVHDAINERLRERNEKLPTSRTAGEIVEEARLRRKP